MSNDGWHHAETSGAQTKCDVTGRSYSRECMSDDGAFRCVAPDLRAEVERLRGTLVEMAATLDDDAVRRMAADDVLGGDVRLAEVKRLRAEAVRLSAFVEAVREALDETDDSRALARIIAALGLLDGGE